MSTAATIGSVAVQLLRMYLELMRMSGRTPEETDAFYRAEDEKFWGVNQPTHLPKPEND